MIVGSMTAVTVDDVHGFIYWSDNTVKKVRRVRLDGSNQTDVYGKLSCVTDQMMWCVLL